jgi:6-phospho-beta-glucosidase
MDIDGSRLEFVDGFVQRLVQKAEESFRIITSDDLKESIAGADIVITQLRVGKMQTQREDEYMGMRHGLIGQETNAIGGMSKALHAVPMILEICDLICEHLPGASLPSPYHSTIVRW